MVGTLDQQAAEIDVASLGDAELRVSLAGLAASWPQAEVAADIATSLEACLASQRQDVSQSRDLPDTVDLDQRLCLWILRLSELLDQSVVVLDLLRHLRDLLEHRTKRLTWWKHRHAPFGEAQGGRGWQTIAAGLSQSTHRVHRCRPGSTSELPVGQPCDGRSAAGSSDRAELSGPASPHRPDRHSDRCERSPAAHVRSLR